VDESVHDHSHIHADDFGVDSALLLNAVQLTRLTKPPADRASVQCLSRHAAPFMLHAQINTPLAFRAGFGHISTDEKWESAFAHEISEPHGAAHTAGKPMPEWLQKRSPTP
jgi:hypothetical protein